MPSLRCSHTQTAGQKWNETCECFLKRLERQIRGTKSHGQQMRQNLTLLHFSIEFVDILCVPIAALSKKARESYVADAWINVSLIGDNNRFHSKHNRGNVPNSMFSCNQKCHCVTKIPRRILRSRCSWRHSGTHCKVIYCTNDRHSIACIVDA